MKDELDKIDSDKGLTFNTVSLCHMRLMLMRQWLHAKW